MNKNAKLFILVLMMATLMLASCGAKEAATPTTNPNLIYTAAAQTANVRLTQIFQATPKATTPAASPTADLTQTSVVQTSSAVLTQIGSQTITPLETATTTVTPAPTSSGGSDRALFVSDVTIPDGTVIAPGATFVKTWKLQNGGTSTWSTGYKLEFIAGEQMGNTTSVPLSQPVGPGQQIDISVEMVAPNATGSYQGNWKMKNTSGQFFDDAVYVLITVGSGGANPTNTPGGGTVVPSPTTTGQPANPITNLSMSVDQGSFTGQCPHTFNFAASITLNQSATLTYGLGASSETPGFTFDLPDPVTGTFNAGTVSLPFLLEFSSTGTGKIWLHVTSPVDESSNQAAFDLTCNP